MTDDDKSLADIAAAAVSDAQKAHEAMMCVMEHYVRHHEVVLKKLSHAREATLTSIREIEALFADVENARAHNELKEIRKYDKLWDSIIESFREAGISEDDLNNIESVLDDIPRAIRKHYELLLAQDKALQALIAQLADEKYQKAFALIKDVQGLSNPMTGLGPEEYEEHDDHDDDGDKPPPPPANDLPVNPAAKLIKTLPRKKNGGKK
jgi:hypothetical protein